MADKYIRMVNVQTGHDRFGEVRHFTEATANSEIVKRDGWIRQPEEQEAENVIETGTVTYLSSTAEEPEMESFPEIENQTPIDMVTPLQKSKPAPAKRKQAPKKASLKK
jgi:hypothetical protein